MLFPPPSRLIFKHSYNHTFVKWICFASVKFWDDHGTLLEYKAFIISWLHTKQNFPAHFGTCKKVTDSEIVMVMTSQPSLHRHLTTQIFTYFISIYCLIPYFMPKALLLFSSARLANPDIGQVLKVQLQRGCLILNVKERVENGLDK